MPVVWFDPCDPGTWMGFAAVLSPAPGLITLTGGTIWGTIGPVRVHVFPLSMLRSIHAAQEWYASVEDPLTMVPSGSTSGLARTGPISPAGRCSACDQVSPSSSLYFLAAVHVLGLGPSL
jgi:hypothetical protein